MGNHAQPAAATELAGQAQFNPRPVPGGQGRSQGTSCLPVQADHPVQWQTRQGREQVEVGDEVAPILDDTAVQHHSRPAGARGDRGAVQQRPGSSDPRSHHRSPAPRGRREHRRTRLAGDRERRRLRGQARALVAGMGSHPSEAARAAGGPGESPRQRSQARALREAGAHPPPRSPEVQGLEDLGRTTKGPHTAQPVGQEASARCAHLPRWGAIKTVLPPSQTGVFLIQFFESQ